MEFVVYASETGSFWPYVYWNNMKDENENLWVLQFFKTDWRNKHYIIVKNGRSVIKNVPNEF